MYHADYDEFFSIKHDERIRSQWLTNSQLCEKPITQLIDRYDINSKSVLSIGPSYGHEEYWFHRKGGCSLTFIDIDESHTIEDYLKKISLQAEGSHLVYGIGDASDLSMDGSQRFDVCYFSSFTPDMLKNRKVADRISKSSVRRAFDRLSRKSDASYSGGPWPDNEEPLSNLTSRILRYSLKSDGGLLLYQSYGSNVDARTPGYLSAIRKQLLAIGIFLLETYYFIGYPSVHFFAAYKGSESHLKDFLKDLANRPELTRIHGRAQVTFRGLAKFYDLSREN